MLSENIRVWKEFISVSGQIYDIINKKALLAANPVVSNTPSNDNELLRLSILAELDAISLYEQLAAKAIVPEVKALLLDIAKEEKTHIGEFQSVLLKLDPEYQRELENGIKEVEQKQVEINNVKENSKEVINSGDSVSIQ